MGERRGTSSIIMERLQENINHLHNQPSSFYTIQLNKTLLSVFTNFQSVIKYGIKNVVIRMKYHTNH